MKCAPFDYHAPRSQAEALALLARHGEEGKILAGGQSLVPTMAFRLARPASLIDINRVAELDTCRAEGGRLRIGALARHARFERPVAPGPTGALLARAAEHIAHAPIRTRGTFCGSLAHADPASEWCCIALALGADMRVLREGGERMVPAADWFQAVFTTALAPDELLAEASLPLLGPDWRCGFAEFNRRAGDFALAMAVTALRLDAAGQVAEARIALGGVAGTPVLAEAAAASLLGAPPAPDRLRAAAALAAEGFEPTEDAQVPAEYRRDLVRAMTRRALEGSLAA